MCVSSLITLSNEKADVPVCYDAIKMEVCLLK